MEMQRPGTMFVLSAAAAAYAGGPPLEQERLIWSLDLGSDVGGRWTAVAADGTIYAATDARLLAVNPDGSVRWSTPQAGGGEVIDLGPDGTIYTSGPGTPARDDLVAVNPDGSLRWAVQLPTNIVYGPTLGPDGHLYGCMNNDLQDPNPDQGAFSFTVGGALRWTNPGMPVIFSVPDDDWPVQFAGGTLAMGVRTTASGALPWAFDLGGSQQWFGGDLPHEVTGKPIAHPGGFYLTRSHPSGLEATLPDGSLLWQVSAPEQGTTGLPVAFGPDGTIYAQGRWGDLWAVSPAGQTIYFRDFDGGFYQAMSISPDGSTLILGGNDIGRTGYVQAFDARDGSPLWQVNLPVQNGTNVFLRSARYSFSPDGGTAYFTTHVGAGAGPAKLHAIRIGPEMPPPSGGCFANCDGSAAAPVLNVTDFTCFLQRFAAGDAYANCDQSTTEPVLNVADFTCFLRSFAVGCR